MTIDQVIRQSRLESELLDKGYSMVDIYGKPEKFTNTKATAKKVISAVVKFAFIIILLYGIFQCLMYLNAAVTNGTLNSSNMPHIAAIQTYFSSVQSDNQDLQESVDNLQNGTFSVSSSSSSSSNTMANNPVTNMMNGMVESATEQFDGFINMADDAMGDISYAQ